MRGNRKTSHFETGPRLGGKACQNNPSPADLPPDRAVSRVEQRNDPATRPGSEWSCSLSLIAGYLHSPFGTGGIVPFPPGLSSALSGPGTGRGRSLHLGRERPRSRRPAVQLLDDVSRDGSVVESLLESFEVSWLASRAECSLRSRLWTS